MPEVEDERQTYREREGNLAALADKVSVSNVDEIGSVVRALMSEILERVKPAMLAEALEARGLRSSRGRYALPTIYRWADGTIAPPAHVLLESARIAGISIDQYLYQTMEDEPVRRSEFEAKFEDLQETIGALHDALADLQEVQLQAGKGAKIG